jgi:hypothetical protein
MNLQGLNIDAVPAWVRWVAQDEDGSWWGHEFQPSAKPHDLFGGLWRQELGYEPIAPMGRGQPNPEWQAALYPIDTVRKALARRA